MFSSHLSLAFLPSNSSSPRIVLIFRLVHHCSLFLPLLRTKEIGHRYRPTLPLTTPPESVRHGPLGNTLPPSVSVVASNQTSPIAWHHYSRLQPIDSLSLDSHDPIGHSMTFLSNLMTESDSMPVADGALSCPLPSLAINAPAFSNDSTLQWR